MGTEETLCVAVDGGNGGIAAPPGHGMGDEGGASRGDEREECLFVRTCDLVKSYTVSTAPRRHAMDDDALAIG